MGDVDILEVRKRGAAKVQVVLCGEERLEWALPQAFEGAEDSIFYADSSIRSAQGEINKKGAVQPPFTAPAACLSSLFAINLLFPPQSNPALLGRLCVLCWKEAAELRGRRRGAKRVSAAARQRGLLSVFPPFYL